jgi:hypothetical protein
MRLSPVFAVCVALGSAACTTVRPVRPANLESKQLPHVVSVTYPDHSVVVLMDPALSADTLRGVRWGTQDSVAVPLDSVQTVDAKVHDRTKTFLLVATVGVLAVSGVYVMTSGTGTEDLSLRQCSSEYALKHPDEFPQCGR